MTTPVPDRDGFLREWSGLHGGYDATTGMWLVRWWLGLVYRLGRPLAVGGIGPTSITVAGTLLTGAMLPAAALGGPYPLLAAMIVVAGGLLDNLDGCVAVLTRRVTPWGYVLDSLADRICDGIYLVAFWLLGAPGGVCAVAGAAVALLEYLRARAGNVGFCEIGVVTVGERPTRIIITVIAMLGAAIDPGRADLAGMIGAAATATVCAGGLIQLGIVVHRTLRTATLRTATLPTATLPTGAGVSRH
ncbi:CDP-alcohol phosphatidyltransferase family protein [Frankia sp. Cas3]|uniref:CDP-alcohol phosphatidyltransferase family protein n=1 Tax=Frankia sp. Cas3 TaxID=3073926 RepID=UPI002AD292D9|nr:CDP-alcohol phosphatidyltransferase family protein [Frankia sp. Cas3]